MGRIQELEKRLDERRQAAGRTSAARHSWHVRAAHRDARLDRLVEDILEPARKERDRNQEQLVVIRDKLEEIEKDGIDESERKQFLHLRERLESEVDENEELTALIERTLVRGDKMEKDRDRARDRFRDFSKAFKNAVERREKVQKQLKEARADAKKSVLDSEFFVVAEFDCNDGTPVPSASIPALKAAVNSYLDPLRKSGGVVHINSGFRTLTYNRSVGGASLSVHVYDGPWQHSPWSVAIDHIQAGRSPAGVAYYHEQNTRPDGMGRYTSFTHVDNRNRIGWADSRWNGP